MTTPSLFAYPQNHVPHIIPQTVSWSSGQDKAQEWVHPTTYDEIIQMLEDLESGALERRYAPDQLEYINDYLATLAKEGILPNEFEEQYQLEEDLCDLMHKEDSSLQENSSKYMILPALFNGYCRYNIIQCGKISKAWKKTKKFCKKHKKALIIGGVVAVAATAVTLGLIAASSAAASSAVAAGASASSSRSESSNSSRSESSDPPSVPNEAQSQISSNDISVLKSAMEEEIASFKENLAHENFFQSSTPNQGLSLEETGRAIGPIFAHDSLNHLNHHLSNNPQLSQEIQNIASQYNLSLPPKTTNNPLDFGHSEIDRRFTSHSGPMLSDPTKEVNFNALSYQIRGEAARSYGYYSQSVSDFTKAININPTNPIPYLQRSASYFDMGQYNKSVEDFNHFAAQVEKKPFSTPEFTLAFTKALPKGIYESGKGIILFLADLITHPVHTTTQLYNALEALARLAHDDEWGMIGEVLSPEVHQLVTE